MLEESGNLAIPLLPNTSSYDQTIKFRVCRGTVIFYLKMGDEEIQHQLFLKSAVYTSATLTIFIKIVASLGMRVFSVNDLLNNENYIFWNFFCYFPSLLRQAIVVLTGSADVFMNLVTRGASTIKMMKTLFGMLPMQGNGAEVESYLLQVGKYFVGFCGIVSALTSSLAAFLGSVTLANYLTNNMEMLTILGFFVAAANFITNISYRIDKSIDNFEKLLNKELIFTYWKVLFSIIGSTAFLGSCFYGTSNSIRKLLKLLAFYYGNPDTGAGLIPEYEFWINGVTNVSLIFSLVSYFFSQCAEMLRPSSLIHKGRYITLSVKEVVQIYHYLKEHDIHLRKLKFYQAEKLVPELLLFFGITIMPLFIFGEMFGNGLSTFNGCNGLIIQWFYEINQEFSDLQKWMIGVASLFLTVVSSKIYWDFNIVDWVEKMEGQWLSSVLKSLKNPNGVREDSLDQLDQAFTRAMNGMRKNNRHSFFSPSFLRGNMISIPSADPDLPLSSLILQS